MTKLLEQAIAAASKFSAAEQDSVASLLLAELKSEHRWTELFASSQNQLALLAEKALREYDVGETQLMEEDNEVSY